MTLLVPQVLPYGDLRAVGSSWPGQNNEHPTANPSGESSGHSPCSAASVCPLQPPPSEAVHTAQPVCHSQPSGAPLGCGRRPGGDITLASDVLMDEGMSLGRDITLGSDNPMDDGTFPTGDITLGIDINPPKLCCPPSPSRQGPHGDSSQLYCVA